MRAGDLMTANPVTVTPTTTIAEAWDLMTKLEIRHLPVIEKGRMVGIVSDRDLAVLDLGRRYTEEGAEAVKRALSRTVEEVMSPEVVDVEPGTDLIDIVGLLIDHKVGALPVVHPDTGEVLGIVSYLDVLRELQDVLQEVRRG
jgi:acetoin utilization protein AcuB